MALSAEYERGTAGWANEQLDLYESTDGREGGELRGRPIIILRTIGAKTGKLRKTPLMRVEHDGEYAVVASKGGADDHPVWYYNLKAHPLVELQDLADLGEYTAHEAEGGERAAWWKRAVEAWPDYANYAKKTDRLIPVFVLTPSR